MLTTKNGKSILRVRWGRPHKGGHLMRVDDAVFAIVQKVAESDRRRWVTAVIKDAWRRDLFCPVILNCRPPKRSRPAVKG